MPSKFRQRKAAAKGGAVVTAKRSGQQEQLGLRQLVQKRFLEDVFQAATDKFPGWKVLIVDEEAMRVVSHAVGMYDIMEKKVTLVEALEKKRAPFPDQAAVYLLSPTKESVARLVADYEDKSSLLYGNAVFVYFLGHLPDRLLDSIKRCPLLLKRLKALSEINVHFLTKEERAFTLDMRKSFAQFYLRTGNSPIELVIAEKLVTVCATLNEYPHIRYKQTSTLCNSLASIFHLKMNEFVSANKNWWYYGQGETSEHPEAGARERATLLLLDRAEDCLTPLMHDFTYQAMVNDLLDVKDDRITYQAEGGAGGEEGGSEEKDVLLNDKDELWVEMRGKHIAEVIETLSERIKEIVSSSTGSALAGKNTGKQMSIADMAQTLKAIPEYKEVMSKLSQHMHLSHQCMDVFREQELLELSELEQCLATGKDDEGHTPKLNDMIDKVERTLSSMSDPKARLRLILITTISQGGLRSQDRDRLLRAAEMSRKDVQTLNSLESLGISIFSSGEPTKKVTGFFGGFGGSGKIQAAGASDDESEYTASRYVPNIKGVLEELVAGTLSLTDFPSVLPMPEASASSGTAASARRRPGAGGTVRGEGARKGGPTSRWSRDKGGKGDGSGKDSDITFTGSRNIVFMVGGMSFPELRVTREIMRKEARELVVGSTFFASPKEFIDDLESLSSSEFV